MRYERITIRPDQMGGHPCIRGMRIPVATVMALLADGMSHTEILKAYPDLESEDIGEALRYAAEAWQAWIAKDPDGPIEDDDPAFPPSRAHMPRKRP